MVISHSDADHLGEASTILEECRVERIVHTGYPRETASWQGLMQAIADETMSSSASVRSLETHPLIPGETIALGDEVTLTMLAGWREWDGSGPTVSELRNAISIVLRLDYAGRSVLFTGDTVGRRLGDPDDACRDAEAWMVDQHRDGVYSLAADVLLAPHHGGNNGSSRCFIDAVDPEWVIFSSGHLHDHPSTGAANRYLEAVQLSRILRTDRGDSEGGSEWQEGSIPGCEDQSGDDDISVILRESGTLSVGYLQVASGC
jgi:beta-lactamase superfamily II metal-dependent hydrolase